MAASLVEASNSEGLESMPLPDLIDSLTQQGRVSGPVHPRAYDTLGFLYEICSNCPIQSCDRR